MGEYDFKWFREVVHCVCGISFLIVATCIFIVSFSDFSSLTIYVPLGAFFLSGVLSGWILVIIDFLLMIRGNEDD